MKLTDRPFYKQPWYNSYRSMMDRCYREKAANYPIYGGRGIRVCDEWHDIENFALWVNASGYQEGMSIDRIDNNGDYGPLNCRWATAKQQANNRRNTAYITIDGTTKTISEWADFAGIKRSVIADRYYCQGLRGVMLLHKVENTRFKKGYNRYKFSGHWVTAPTVIEAEEEER